MDKLYIMDIINQYDSIDLIDVGNGYVHFLIYITPTYCIYVKADRGRDNYSVTIGTLDTSNLQLNNFEEDWDLDEDDYDYEYGFDEDDDTIDSLIKLTTEQDPVFIDSIVNRNHSWKATKKLIAEYLRENLSENPEFYAMANDFDIVV